MYPFERFTEAAKRTLTLAQEEAERMHHRYVGTEHLLFALLRQDGTVAAESLATIGVDEAAVRARIEQVIGSNPGTDVPEIILPTARTKKVIEMSFHEARAAGSKLVRTDHILLALIGEGEGIAAHVLTDLGATSDVVRTTVEEVQAGGVDESTSAQLRPAEHAEMPQALSVAPAPPISIRQAMMGAREEASAEHDTTTGEVHHFQYLLRNPEQRIAAALRRFGVDPAQLREATRPPERVLELRRALDAAVIAKRTAATRENYVAAESARQRENQLREALDAAEAVWRQELSAED